MRRLIAALGTTLLLVASAGGASANAPVKESDHTQDAGCFDFETPLGIAEFDGFVSQSFGSDAFLTVWAGEPFNSDIVLDRDPDQTPTVAFGTGTVSMTIPLVPSGVATVTGTLTPAAAISNTDKSRFGNSWNKSTQKGMAFVFTASVTLPGLADPIDVDPALCSATELDQTFFNSAPHAFAGSFEVRNGNCHVENADGDSADVFVDLNLDDFFLDATVTDAGGDRLEAVGDAPPDATGTATFETTEFDPTTFEPLGTTGSATVSAVDTGQLYTYTLRGPSGFNRVRGDLLDVGGTLVTSLGTFSLEPCVALQGTNKIVGPQSNGPKPSGNAPSNDLPSGAITVRSGSKTVESTRSAQPQSETGYPCLAFTDPETGDTSEVPVSNTVWFKLVGTGKDVTVDTAGSDFDTVVAAYAGSADEADAVACNDDVPLVPLGRSLQAAITFPTTVGQTYWIQVGGLDELAFPGIHWVGYGNLKVAVR